MKIKLNNNSDEFEGERLTVTEVLKIKNFTFKMLIVKINGKLIKKDEFDRVTIQDGDKVSIIHLISGG
jgi:thiamine biosynthesis protein ThiS